MVDDSQADSKKKPKPEKDFKAKPNNVKRLRNKFALRQTELTSVSKVSGPSIRGIENRSRNLSITIRMKLVNAFSKISEERNEGKLDFADVFPNDPPAED